MSHQGLALGRYGEAIAEAHLVGRGMVVLERNWHCPRGEIDLVLRDGNTLVICEVKSRSTERFGSPIAAVDATKLARLRLLAELWMDSRGVRPADVRIDLVGVLQDGRGAAEVTHVPGVG